MTFKEKIDKILGTNKLGVNSVHGLEKALKLGVGAINKKYQEGGEPGNEVIKKIKDGLRINNEWWNTGEGQIFQENEAVDSMGNSLIEFISRFEDKTSYKFIPKTILDGEYRIFLKSEIDSKERLLYEVIEAKNGLIEALKNEIVDLRGKTEMSSVQSKKA